MKCTLGRSFGQSSDRCLREAPGEGFSAGAGRRSEDFETGNGGTGDAGVRIALYAVVLKVRRDGSAGHAQERCRDEGKISEDFEAQTCIWSRARRKKKLTSVCKDMFLFLCFPVRPVGQIP